MAKTLKGRGMTMGRGAVGGALFIALSSGILAQGGAPVQQPPVATFKSSVDRVTVNAVVRNKNGRLIPNLRADDFVLTDSGERRDIKEFRAEESPVSIALLFDVSGSMEVGSKLADSRQAGHHLASWLRPGLDELGVFVFDSSLRELQPFTTDSNRLGPTLDAIRPFGATSLRDAIAQTAQRVVTRGRLRRAVVVITDGVDNYSRMSAAEVSGIASAIDVPVYIFGVVSPLDHPGAPTAVGDQSQSPLTGNLADLAHWTGGDLWIASTPSHLSQAARQIIMELRHQYFMAFEPSGKPGWHPLAIRTRDKDLIVRARSGYIAGGNPTS